MTEAQRKIVDDYLREVASKVGPISPTARKYIDDYRTEHERMRQFIRNLADEAQAYLESEE